MYPIDREEYVNAYLAAMKEEMEHARLVHEHGEEDGSKATDRFLDVIAEKLSSWHRKETAPSRWLPTH